MGAIPLKAVTNWFPQAGGNQTQEASGVVFDPTQGDEGVETPPPNDSFQSTSRRSVLSEETGSQTNVQTRC